MSRNLGEDCRRWQGPAAACGLQPGLYDSVLVLDYKEACTRRLSTFLIDPVGLVEGVARRIGTQYRRFSLTFGFHEKSATACRKLLAVWHGRDEAKRQGNKPLSQALKIV